MSRKGTVACLKLFLVAVNFLLLAVGIAVLCVGVYAATDASLARVSDVLEAARISLRSTQSVLIVCGCLVSLLGLCGLVGVCRENRCLIMVYATLLVLILVASAAAMGIAVTLKKQVALQTQRIVEKFYGNTSDAVGLLVTQVVDKMQKQGECCGWTGSGNVNIFVRTPWYRLQNQSQPLGPHVYPDSCCAGNIIAEIKKEDTAKYNECVRAVNDTVARTIARTINSKDCLDETVNIVYQLDKAIYVSVFCAMLLQILCIVFSLLLVTKISSGDGDTLV